MNWNVINKMFNKKPAVPSPEDIPPDKLSPLSRKYMNWKTGMMVVVGVLMVFAFLQTLVTNPTISGYAVVSADSQDTERFTGMASLLVVVFGFFGLFLFILSRRARLKRGR